MIVINNYDKVNKKFLSTLYIIAFICMIFIIVSVANSKKDMQFYKNAKQVNCLVKNKKKKDNKNIIRVSYKIGSKIYSGDIFVSNKEFDTIHIGDKMEIFYNTKKATDCRMTSHSMLNILMIIIILLIVMLICIVKGIFYSISIRTNQKLINENNVVDAKFYRLEFKKSIFGNDIINYVYCKAIVNEEKRIFKSIGFKEKPKPLNDTSNITVYIDNKNNYLVNIYDLI